jgi:bifunctional UDP-N-acetylglucosamine pyrophosphorylase/glucosamine-1-phosphate N-acetyltransferase
LRKAQKTASIIFAAGKGSRVKGFNGNKTMLPLIPGPSPFEGEHPILLHIINSLPPGPKAVVVNHMKEEVMESTSSLDLTYCEQPVLNGTGGALLAAREFMEKQDCGHLLITMGDVPLVSPSTFQALLSVLKDCHMAVLGFRPRDKKEYGTLEIRDTEVKRIIEWKYWRQYPEDVQERLEVCNSGIYAARRPALVRFMDVLRKSPHKVLKERDQGIMEGEEFFITDLVELMNMKGLRTGYVLAGGEDELTGVDDLESLIKVQERFRQMP